MVPLMRILPDMDVAAHRNTEPNYNDYNIRELLKPNELTTLVCPDGGAPGTLLQQAWFSMGTFDAGQDFSYSLHNEQNGIYVFVIEGEAQMRIPR